MKKNKTEPMKSELILYQTKDGKTKVEVRLQDETVWLPQRLMAELFQKDVRTINEHIANVYDEGELMPEATVRKFRIVQHEGNRQVGREIEHYNLDVIISVGYRVKSHRGTQFRIWATQRLREYIVKGFALDDERLKQAGGGLYFDELLARIRASALRRRSSGARCWISTPPALTIHLTPNLPGSSLLSYRTRCTGLRMVTRPPRLSTNEQMQPSRIWA